MAQQTWTINLDGREHSVTLNWTYYGGEREVLVDGRIVNEDKKLLRWESNQEFEIDGHQCTVITHPQSPNITKLARSGKGALSNQCRSPHVSSAGRRGT